MPQGPGTYDKPGRPSKRAFKLRSGNSPAFKQMGNMPITPPPAMPVSPMQPPITQKSKYETPGTKYPGQKKGKSNTALDKLSDQHSAIDRKI